MLELDAALEPFPTLGSERLVLRAPTTEDAPAIYRMLSDPTVLRYFGMPALRDELEAARYLEGLRRQVRERSGVRWALTRRDGGPLLGTVAFWRIMPEHARAEVGYYLAPDAWGHGYMREALAAVLSFGFRRMGLHSVEAQTHPENAASRRVLAALGFTQEGHFRENYFDPYLGSFTDTAVFSLLGRDWTA